MKSLNLKQLIKEEIANVIAENKNKKASKKSLKEGYAWERSEHKFGQPLPTLASVQKAYQSKHNITEAGTQLMSDPAVKSKVEMVIKTLLSIGADGETMQYILSKVGKKWKKQFTGHSGGGNM